MNTFELVRVLKHKIGAETVRSVVEKTGDMVRINLDAVAYIETMGDGGAYDRWNLVTMKDGKFFRVSAD